MVNNSTPEILALVSNHRKTIPTIYPLMEVMLQIRDNTPLVSL